MVNSAVSLSSQTNRSQASAALGDGDEVNKDCNGRIIPHLVINRAPSILKVTRTRSVLTSTDADSVPSGFEN